MYVLVISLLNKINQVREMKICSFKPFLSRKCMHCLVGQLVGWLGFFAVEVSFICLALTHFLASVLSLQSKVSPLEVSAISDATNTTVIPVTTVTSNATAGKIFSYILNG